MRRRQAGTFPALRSEEDFTTWMAETAPADLVTCEVAARSDDETPPWEPWREARLAWLDAQGVPAELEAEVWAWCIKAGRDARRAWQASTTPVDEAAAEAEQAALLRGIVRRALDAADEEAERG